MDIKEHHKTLSLSFILSRARQCVSYVSAYTDHLTQTYVDENIRQALEQTENELNYEEVVILRRIAMQRIEKEKELAKVSYIVLNINVMPS